MLRVPKQSNALFFFSLFWGFTFEGGRGMNWPRAEAKGPPFLFSNVVKAKFGSTNKQLITSCDREMKKTQ